MGKFVLAEELGGGAGHYEKRNRPFIVLWLSSRNSCTICDKIFYWNKRARFFSSPVRTITSLYWFCVQTIGGTMMIIEICRRCFQVEPEFAPLAMLLGTGMAAIAAAGFDAVKKITRYFPPFFLAG
ncbi:hypothetical protein AB1K32_00175 [Metabacillus dongyingensis]|uniref:hypothetical protein n=1 Tax=Metabacillus dongyingensis TaxID=2874282 RepID=UPI003B8C9132